MHADFYINGQWIAADQRLEVENPATRSLVGTVASGGEKEATAAVDAAADALAAWRALTAFERADHLWRWHDAIADNREELARLMTMEQGKPLAEARGEVDYGNSYIAWYAEEGKRLYGQTVPASSADKRILVLRQPVGVVAAITPWNFPAAMLMRKLAPALAAGCTAVLKPSELTPLTAYRLAALADEAGMPAGVINVITGDAAAIGAAWMADRRVRKLSFTGSTRVGKLLYRQAADTMKKLSLELGGHAPYIVTAHADLDEAAAGLIAPKFRNAGQTCICPNRVYVHEQVHDAFIAKLRDALAQLKVGDGLAPDTTVGPLINAEATAKMQRHVDDALAHGAQVAAQITAPTGPGYYMQPTVLTGVADEMLCMREETFGPLLPIASYKTTEEVLRRANAMPYGLAAYAHTQDLSEAIHLAEGLEYGIVGLNDGLPSTAQAPFGGMKESGLGREGGHWGIEDYLETKYVSMKIR